MAKRGCTYTNAAGDACGMAPLKKSEGCFIHDISVRSERLLARANAGRATKLSKAKAQLRKARALEEVKQLLEKTELHDKVKAILDEAFDDK